MPLHRSLLVTANVPTSVHNSVGCGNFPVVAGWKACYHHDSRVMHEVCMVSEKWH